MYNLLLFKLPGPHSWVGRIVGAVEVNGVTIEVIKGVVAGSEVVVSIVTTV